MGYLTRHLAAHLAPLMDAGVLTPVARVSMSRGGDYDPRYFLPLELALCGEGPRAQSACEALMAAAQASAVVGRGGARARLRAGKGRLAPVLTRFRPPPDR
jgi:hypothetical protein